MQTWDVIVLHEDGAVRSHQHLAEPDARLIYEWACNKPSVVFARYWTLDYDGAGAPRYVLGNSYCREE